MSTTIIVAMDKDRGIGYQNTIPWTGKIPADMRHFKEMTMGHPVIMGRNTYLSLGKALPNRTNIVLSSSPSFTAPDAQVVGSLDLALEAAKGAFGAEEIFVIGGAQVYRTTLPYADRLVITFVDGAFEADAHFPEWNGNEWAIESAAELPADEKNLFALRFVTFKRVAKHNEKFQG